MVKKLIEVVLSWMDRRFAGKYLVAVPPGSTLQLVFGMDPLFSIEKALITLVWVLRGEPEDLPNDLSSSWLLFRKFLLQRQGKKGNRAVGIITTFLIAIPFTAAVAFLGVVIYSFRNFAETLESGIQFWPGVIPGILVAVLLLVWAFLTATLSVVGEYLVREWERRHYAVAVWDTVVWVVRLPILGAAASSRGLTSALRETKTWTAGEREGAQAPTLIGRWWDRFLYWKTRQIGAMFLPTREFGGADILDYVAYVSNTMNILHMIAGLAEEVFALKGALSKKLAEGVYLDPDSAKRAEDGGELKELFRGRYEEITGVALGRRDIAGWEIVDIFSLKDPGLWPRDQIRTTPAIAAQPAKPTPVFPPA